MELGKLKVIKSEDYSTAKLLKFLREVGGFRPELNSKALRGQQYTLFTIYFSLSLFHPVFSFHQAHRQYRVASKLLFIGASAPSTSPLSPSAVALCRHKSKSQRENK